MNFDWQKLLALEYGHPAARLGFELSPFRDHVYQVDDRLYFLAENFDYYDRRLKYFGFAWTASKGVAERIFKGDALADDGVNENPPDCLLPQAGMTSYRAIVEYGRISNYRNFSDTVIGQTMVTFGDYTYFFRKCLPPETDYPIAVMVDLRPDKDLFAAL